MALSSTSSLSNHKISIILDEASSSFPVMVVRSIFNSKTLITILSCLLRHIPLISAGILVLIFIVFCNCVFVSSIVFLILRFVNLVSVNLKNRSESCENFSHFFVTFGASENVHANERDDSDSGAFSNAPVVEAFLVWLLIDKA